MEEKGRGGEERGGERRGVREGKNYHKDNETENGR